MQSSPNILVVIVLYRVSLAESRAYQSWKATQAYWQKCTPQLLLYNNGPAPLEVENPKHCLINAPMNQQLAGAYNQAWKMAQQEDIPWLMLFDQDTEFSAEYIQEVEQSLERYSVNCHIAMLLPRFFHQGKQQVPYTYCPRLFHEWKKNQLAPQTLTNKCVFTFNSGIVLRRSAIDSLKGFSLRYPLDYQDADYLLRLYKKGYAAYVMNICLQHDLSVWNYAQNMTAERYQTIIDAQKRMASDCGCFCSLSLRVYMFCRILKWMLVSDKRKYVLQTLKNII